MANHAMYLKQTTPWGPMTLAELYQKWEDELEGGDGFSAAHTLGIISEIEAEGACAEFNAFFDSLCDRLPHARHRPASEEKFAH